MNICKLTISKPPLSFMCVHSVVLSSFVEKTILFSLNSFGSLVKKKRKTLVLESQFFSIGLCLSSCQDLGLDCYCFVISFEIKKCESIKFVVFQDCFDYFGSISFTYEC